MVTDENMTRTGAEKEWCQAWQSTFATAFLPSLRACCLAPPYHGLRRYGSHGGRMWQQKGKGVDDARASPRVLPYQNLGLSQVVEPLSVNRFGTIFIIYLGFLLGFPEFLPSRGVRKDVLVASPVVSEDNFINTPLK